VILRLVNCMTDNEVKNVFGTCYEVMLMKNHRYFHHHPIYITCIIRKLFKRVREKAKNGDSIYRFLSCTFAYIPQQMHI
jgi:hypothetical protein